MDLALLIDRLLPAAEYRGSLTDNTQEAFDALVWEDERTKPTWQEIIDEWDVFSSEQDNLKEYKIYDLLAEGSQFKDTDKTRLPVDIDFKTGLATDLYQETIMDGGAPSYKQYYTDAEIDSNGVIVYTNPIVRIDYEFDRDSISLAISCTQTISWYDVDGNLSSGNKIVKDFYNTVEKMAEAGLRRKNIIDDLKVKTIGLLMLTEEITQPAAAELGRPFLATHKTDIVNYIDEANIGFATSVTNASAETYPWLDNMTPYSVTIRQFILNAIT